MTTLNARNVALNAELKKMTTLNTRNVANAELKKYGGFECQTDQ